MSLVDVPAQCREPRFGAAVHTTFVFQEPRAFSPGKQGFSPAEKHARVSALSLAPPHLREYSFSPQFDVFSPLNSSRDENA